MKGPFEEAIMADENGKRKTFHWKGARKKDLCPKKADGRKGINIDRVVTIRWISDTPNAFSSGKGSLDVMYPRSSASKSIRGVYYPSVPLRIKFT